MLSFQVHALEFRKRANAFIQSEGDFFPIGMEKRMGQSLATRFVRSFSLSSNKKMQKYISTLGSGLAAEFGREDIDYHFVLIKGNEINAFACPGGYIFITEKAVTFAHNEAEILGILLHEIYHVNEKHVLKSLKLTKDDNDFANAIGMLLHGTNASFISALNLAINKSFSKLTEEGLQKRAELESDLFTLEALLSLGYSPQAYAYFLERLSKEQKNRSVFNKTHPEWNERLGFLASSLLSLGKMSGKKLTGRFNNWVK